MYGVKKTRARSTLRKSKCWQRQTLIAAYEAWRVQNLWRKKRCGVGCGRKKCVGKRGVSSIRCKRKYAQATKVYMCVYIYIYIYRCIYVRVCIPNTYSADDGVASLFLLLFCFVSCRLCVV